MSRHQNRPVALVTGGTSGLGLTTAERLLADGMRPVLFGRSRERGKSAVRQLGGEAVFVAGDVAVEGDVERAVAVAAERGELRAVVNCAGRAHAARVVGRSGPHSLKEFAEVVTANLTGTFNVVRLGAESMARNEPVAGERGVVVNTASIAAFDGQIGQAAYAASKAGVAGMTLPLARELAGLLIRVVTVAPGLFDTPAAEVLPPAKRAALAGLVPHPRRWGQAHEFAHLVAHVIGNPMLNGETIRLDGGLRLPAS
ncbi:NAD(P)-dependent dehydrogenase, short-chain alcohol dehydrogenase family [Streptomyces sp. yr375]|uniref:SDR family NAD(P)-dependent oxidoreductase n=1 Tax=Streptomyces sp. yr375 TaxID=1761906 RepID=UPI0008B6F31B|nr:SDR family NAD(P)-dependent oxidoreductase [Streptomyces sp. yr375]SEQ48240.1 NAD(P)-dependent dehydrogenase, short-chain alcohol dehydrogenase family [Streptomyces sp. yr375]